MSTRREIYLCTFCPIVWSQTLHLYSRMGSISALRHFASHPCRSECPFTLTYIPRVATLRSLPRPGVLRWELRLRTPICDPYLPDNFHVVDLHTSMTPILQCLDLHDRNFDSHLVQLSTLRRFPRPPVPRMVRTVHYPPVAILRRTPVCPTLARFSFHMRVRGTRPSSVPESLRWEI